MKLSSKSDKVFNLFNYLFLSMIMVLVLYPLYFVLIASVSDQDLVNSGQVLFFPKGLTLDGFERVFAYPNVWIGYRNTVFYTVVGTAISVTGTLLISYPLSRVDFKPRKIISLLLLIVMIFPAGMIPRYLIVSGLNMDNTPWALLIPSSIWVYNIIIARTFFGSTIPGELHDAAQIDGCSDWRFFIKIVMPLSIPLLIIMCLYYGVDKWNSYFEAMIYISEPDYQPLQLILKNILISSQVASQSLSDAESAAEQLKLADSIKYCIIIISTVPMMVAYLLLQKHLVKGVMLGAIKG